MRANASLTCGQGLCQTTTTHTSMLHPRHPYFLISDPKCNHSHAPCWTSANARSTPFRPRGWKWAVGSMEAPVITHAATHHNCIIHSPNHSYTHCRHQMLPSYKGHRAEKPPNLYDELSRMLVMIEAMGIPILSVPGVEADDVCGALAVKAVKDGFDIVLVSPDRVRGVSGGSGI
eukprot:GHUV01047864.1.p1 GENE.GHUV01047864.1~~GHUV01047864.1.p1  ORF type:complete len:175 (-),score=28.49 GHUV01047864.1:75-599(-)